MTAGKAIEELVLTNIKIWHEATKIKDFNGASRNDKKLSVEKRVQIAYRIRKLNSRRSKLRWEIDKIFDQGTNETKLNTHPGE